MDVMPCNSVPQSDMSKLTGAQGNYPDRSITYENLSENTEKVSEEINWGDSMLSLTREKFR